MFKTAEKTELNQISLTGLRALVFIGLLIMQPRSFDEIRKILIDLKIMDKNHSDDILRIDLNTIKLMGCEISRPTPSSDYKYVLTKHPFCLSVPEKELLILKKAYNIVKQKANLTTLLEYHQLFDKIAFHICDEETKESMLGISVLKNFDYQMIIDLIEDCKYKRIVDLTYKKPNTMADSRKQIIAQEIVFKNDKLYLYGHNLSNDKPIVLNLKRIKSILLRKNQDKDVETNQTKIKFLLKNVNKEDLSINEEIIEKTENGFIIEGSYHNEFLATQRILSFGSRCTVIEPLEFKESIITKIKEMKNIYGC